MTQQNIHIMVDLETTALSPNAGIVQIGAACFSQPPPNVDKYFDMRCSPVYNQSHGYDIDPATMQWWDKQPPALRNHVFSGQRDIKQALGFFVNYCQDLSNGNLKNVYLWANHIDFDLVVLKNAFYKEHGNYPFDFRKHMDYANLKVLYPQLAIERDEILYPPHDALADAVFQGKHTSVILQELQANGLVSDVFYTVPG